MEHRKDGRYFEEVDVGFKYTTGTHTVTQKDLDEYCRITGNVGELHVDREYIKTTQFKDVIVPGPLTFGITNSLDSQVGMFHNRALGMLGIEDMRFPNPVYPGDTIGVELELTFKRETKRPDRGIVKLRHTGHKQDGSVVVEYVRAMMVKRRPS
ncbi:MAG: MaoC family dehydratase [Chloroflexi bacterium]|nr:MaoC family dehydratase [Chloroflexota bacterium]